MRRSILFALALLLPVSALACDDDDPASPGSVQGTYTLTSINGEALPYTEDQYVQNGMACEDQISSGSLLLEASAFTIAFDFRVVCEGETMFTQELVFTGSYTVSGSTVTLDFGGGDTDSGTVSGAVIVFDLEGDSWRFVRQ